jgi:uncharacterized protein (TIGR02284 family)
MGRYTYDTDLLNTLIGLTMDSAESYDDAARNSTEPQYAAVCQLWAADRRRVAESLRQQVRALGGRPSRRGVQVAANRLLMDLRHALSRSDAAPMEQIARGEAHLQQRFENALHDLRLSLPTLSAIENAYISIKAGHEQACNLKQTTVRNQRTASLRTRESVR